LHVASPSHHPCLRWNIATARQTAWIQHGGLFNFRQSPLSDRHGCCAGLLLLREQTRTQRPHKAMVERETPATRLPQMPHGRDLSSAATTEMEKSFPRPILSCLVEAPGRRRWRTAVLSHPAALCPLSPRPSDPTNSVCSPSAAATTQHSGRPRRGKALRWGDRMSGHTIFEL
jgi:hypothetical protein